MPDHLNICLMNDSFPPLLDGALDIRWDEQTGHILMTGPARTVFSGEYILAQGQED